MEEIFYDLNIPDHGLWIKLATCTFRDKASAWWKWISNHKGYNARKMSWVEFEEVFNRHFFNEDEQKEHDALVEKTETMERGTTAPVSLSRTMEKMVPEPQSGARYKHYICIEKINQNFISTTLFINYQVQTFRIIQLEEYAQRKFRGRNFSNGERM